MAPIDSLPPELLIYILHRALPPTPPSYSTFAARSRLLRSLALVSKAWTDIAQAELLAHPLVRTAKKLAMLEATVNQRKALRVRTLCAGDGGRTLHGGLVVDLLGKISPREVWLHTVNALVLNDLAGDADLEELHCFKCTFVDLNNRRSIPTARLGSAPLPSLRRLHLDGCRFSTYPTNLPQLTTLSLHNPQFPFSFAHPNVSAVASQTGRLSEWILGLAPQLLAFSFNTATYLELRLMHHLHRFTSLQFLDLSHAAFLSNRPQLLNDLPSSLRILRITDTFVEAEELAKFIVRSPHRRLEIIVLVGGSFSEGLSQLMELDTVAVKLELSRGEGGESVTGERVLRGEEWMDPGCWEVVKAMEMRGTEGRGSGWSLEPRS